MSSINPKYKDFDCLTAKCKVEKSFTQNSNLINIDRLVAKNKSGKLFNSSLNPISKNKILERDTFISNNKKVTFGLAGITALATFFISIFKAKEKSLPEHIEFQEAKTLKDAVDFGKKNLGIKTYKGFSEDDLVVVNWINQALVNTSNALKGRFNCPKKIVYDSFDVKQVAYVEGSNTMGFNKDYISNLDSSIKLNTSKRILENFDADQIAPLRAKLAKFESGESMTLNEKISLLNSLHSVAKETDRDSTEIFLEIIKDEKARNNLKKNGFITPDGTHILLGKDSIELTAEGIRTVHPYLRNLWVKTFLDESGYKLKFQDQSPFRLVYHELGHLQNTYPERNDNTTGAQSLAQKLENWGYSKKDYRTALEISEYASISPDEFCAEVFAELMSGNKLSDNVMELYARYKGVIPKP